MTVAEFWLAWLFNLRWIFGAIGIASLIFGGVHIFFWANAKDDWDYDSPDKCSPREIKMQEARVAVVARAKRTLSWLPVFAGLVFALSSAPDPADMWKLRIGLLKLAVVDKENLMKLTDRADEVVSALECKYLNTHCPGSAEKTDAKPKEKP